MTLTGKDRAALRAEAHHLTIGIHIGHQGFTDAVRVALDDMLRVRELVKVQWTKHDERRARDVAGEIAAAVGAEVIQVIGRALTLYRHNPELEQKPGASPPWRA